MVKHTQTIRRLLLNLFLLYPFRLEFLLHFHHNLAKTFYNLKYKLIMPSNKLLTFYWWCVIRETELCQVKSIAKNHDLKLHSNSSADPGNEYPATKKLMMVLLMIIDDHVMQRECWFVNSSFSVHIFFRWGE